MAIRRQETTPGKARLTDVTLIRSDRQPCVPYLPESDRNGCYGALQALSASGAEIVVPKHDASMTLAFLDGPTYHHRTRRNRGRTRENARSGGRVGGSLVALRAGRDAIGSSSHLSNAKILSVHSSHLRSPPTLLRCRFNVRWAESERLPEPI